ncbi:2-succinyl-5-enolpyruvyl-6-hydroxy-3-cyclohexene-1-carboxylic-acid synthase [Diaminobutyricibacter tongyongensis]|uniref:2-succinyl-5-enolpyruvyl-6-hydroxy-3-cyclohexene-1-carboxylate synthase n=1 Tax=Leifsonia tongyongensis TaxID=1268043 RepID=A0A6L9Y4F4_9MICO|nr:2-succinyl-5-enolpyruvyl-6-hydroxy-3-cyclohexene-1-carboxylic-acid synthase [Diaminobutyricibacter tongyongensis]NEN08028.1 2-succinyl-5-enolpyruvyl-6-hydroxy-3-cyclohexene-1-carboxylic-acid synthase [Diaminobutyricibacter tongyongensis]
MHDAPTGNPATDYSLALLTEFVRLGVRDVVLSPGSRSQALALVVAELERSASVRLHVRIDERVSGFLALGLAIESGRPAVVITTSGTATANLHPAVLEAHHSMVPMIVITADRPTELRGIRSNQTTVQPGLFGGAVRCEADVEAPHGAPGEPERARELARTAVVAALGSASGNPGPVHLNVAFREPLSVAVPPDAVRASSVPYAPAVVPDAVTVAGRPVIELPAGIRTVVIAGAGAGPEAEALARDGGWPLLAEVSSGARFGPNLVVSYRELLGDDDFGGRIDRAIVFGHPTLSREVPALLIGDAIETIVVAPRGAEVYDPGRRATIAGAVVASPEHDPDSREARAWTGSWVFASRALREERERASDPGLAVPDLERAMSSDPVERGAFARAELAAVRAPITRPMLAEALWRFTWPYDRLVLGASRLIRDADRIVPGKRIRVHSNRGLAGIDGTISTAIGISLASRAAADAGGEASGVTRVLLGDLALLHDAGALLLGDGEPRPHLQLVVGNDGGGTIFDGLEVASTAPEASLDRVMYTPQHVDIAALAAAYGWHHRVVRTRGELDRALSAPPAGPSILEVPLDR